METNLTKRLAKKRQPKIYLLQRNNIKLKQMQDILRKKNVSYYAIRMQGIECTKEDFKKFLLSKQFLLQPKELRGIDGIAKVFSSLRSIQYDPQDICGKNADLVLGARVSGISPSDYHEWIYGQRKGIETYDKELCIIPIEDTEHNRGRFPPARQAKLDRFLAENRKKLGRVLEFVKKHGPTASSDIAGKEKVDIFWEPATWNKAALDSLWKTGKLAVVKREGNRKYYDIPERAYGKKIEHRKQGAVLRKEHVIRRIAAVGSLPASGSSSGWTGLGTGKEINRMIEELAAENRLAKVKIAGVKRNYVINAGDKNLLAGMKNTRFEKRVSFLPPLDNLLWDREMVREIFGFDYKWEAYTPAAKRKYGHYVLPVLYGTDFIGRISPKFNKRTQTLEITGFYPEREHEWSRETQEAFSKCVIEFKSFLGARKVEWKANNPGIIHQRRKKK